MISPLVPSMIKIVYNPKQRKTGWQVTSDMSTMELFRFQSSR